MAKGMFTQGLVLLFSAPPSLDELETVLGDWEILGRKEESENVWIGGQTLAVAYRPEVNGVALIDVVPERWPDHMGDPESETDLFAAWAMGHLAPFAFPDNLSRAVQQSWAWDGGSTAVRDHRFFVRLRISYVLGAEPDSKVLPEDYHAESELNFLTGLASRLLQVEGGLAYFNPGGEILQSATGLSQALAFAQEHGRPPIDLWTNVRVFNPENGWMIMDSVGMAQLDTLDIEACFPAGMLAPQEVAGFVRNVSLYLHQSGQKFENDQTVDGPGGTWRALLADDGLISPPRATVRFFPSDATDVPEDMLKTNSEEG